MTRRWRVITAILSLCALLFTQGALAAHACGGAAKAALAAEMAAEMAAAAMPCADTMPSAMEEDPQAALCHAHCQSASSTVDSPQPLPLADVARLGAVLVVRPVDRPELSGLAVQASMLRTRASPPLAISNCCLRI